MDCSTSSPYVLKWHPSQQWPATSSATEVALFCFSLFIPLFQKTVVYSLTSLLLFLVVAILLQPNSSSTPGHHQRPLLFKTTDEVKVSSCKQRPTTPPPPSAKSIIGCQRVLLRPNQGKLVHFLYIVLDLIWVHTDLISKCSRFNDYRTKKIFPISLIFSIVVN